MKGTLPEYKPFGVTPVIGREFLDVTLKEWFRAPNSEDLFRDLAITNKFDFTIVFSLESHSNRQSLGAVCIFSEVGRPRQRAAKRIGPKAQRIAQQTRNISTPHPPCEQPRTPPRRQGRRNQRISSEQAKEIYRNRFVNFNKKRSAKDGWNSNITFEPIPSDYVLLRLTQLPETNGGMCEVDRVERMMTDAGAKDVLWVSGYELYDRLSKLCQSFFDKLTATYTQPGSAPPQKIMASSYMASQEVLERT